MKPLNVLTYLMLIMAFVSIEFSNVKRSQDVAIKATRSFVTSIVGTLL